MIARSDHVRRLDGTVAAAWWLIVSGVLTVVRLLERRGDVVTHLAAWRAVVGPTLFALVAFVAARDLLRDGRAVRMPAMLLGLQILAFSAGPLAYRLDAGLFVRIGFGTAGAGINVGSDARLLLIAGSRNTVPPGVAINVLAIAALALLLAVPDSQRIVTDLEIPLG